MTQQSDVIAMLTLMMTTTTVMSQLSDRLHDDNSELDGMQPFAIALTPPPRALPPNVARLDEESAADAAAIREEGQKARQKLRLKEKEIAIKHRHGQPQTDSEPDEQRQSEKNREEKTAKQTQEEVKKEMRHRKEHHRGHKKSNHSLSTVKQHTVTHFVGPTETSVSSCIS